jgi:hypothetical protein
MIKNFKKDVECKLGDNVYGSYSFTVLRDKKMWILSDPDINKFVADVSFWSFIIRILKKALTRIVKK